jgi:hypothetical protein
LSIGLGVSGCAIEYGSRLITRSREEKKGQNLREILAQLRAGYLSALRLFFSFFIYSFSLLRVL